MCAQTTCRTCGKPTWAGCGRHVEQALAGVPKEKRCSCPRDAPSAGATAKKRLWPFG